MMGLTSCCCGAVVGDGTCRVKQVSATHPFRGFSAFLPGQSFPFGAGGLGELQTETGCSSVRYLVLTKQAIWNARNGTFSITEVSTVDRHLGVVTRVESSSSCGGSSVVDTISDDGVTHSSGTLDESCFTTFDPAGIARTLIAENGSVIALSDTSITTYIEGTDSVGGPPVTVSRTDTIQLSSPYLYADAFTDCEAMITSNPPSSIADPPSVSATCGIDPGTGLPAIGFGSIRRLGLSWTYWPKQISSSTTTESQTYATASIAKQYAANSVTLSAARFLSGPVFGTSAEHSAGTCSTSATGATTVSCGLPQDIDWNDMDYPYGILTAYACLQNAFNCVVTQDGTSLWNAMTTPLASVCLDTSLQNAHLDFTSPAANAFVGVATTYKVRLKNASNQPYASSQLVTIVIALASGTGGISGTLAVVTPANAEATFSVIYSASGAKVLTASCGGAVDATRNVFVI